LRLLPPIVPDGAACRREYQKSRPASFVLVVHASVQLEFSTIAGLPTLNPLLRMKRVRFLNLVLAAWLFVPSGFGQDQPPRYLFEPNIPYRDGGAGGVDEYMAARCVLDVYRPADATGFATVVWFHGGGLRNGEKFIPAVLRNQGIAVVAANYRLSPQTTCPAYIEDAAAAVAWVFENIERLGGDSERIFVSGHSAGGYLASMVGLDKRWLAAHGIDANRIAGLIPQSGQAVTHSTVREERGIPEVRPIIDEFAPLAHARADASPLMLITGDRKLDLPARYDESAYLESIMKLAGHEHTVHLAIGGTNHNSMVDPACHLLLGFVRNTVGETEE
jgi:acetyl esterase/lipase